MFSQGLVAWYNPAFEGLRGQQDSRTLEAYLRQTQYQQTQTNQDELILLVEEEQE